MALFTLNLSRNSYQYFRITASYMFFKWVKSVNEMLTTCWDNTQELALTIFHDMQTNGRLRADAVTCSSAVSACERGRCWHLAVALLAQCAGEEGFRAVIKACERGGGGWWSTHIYLGRFWSELMICLKEGQCPKNVFESNLQHIRTRNNHVTICNFQQASILSQWSRRTVLLKIGDVELRLQRKASHFSHRSMADGDSFATWFLFNSGHRGAAVFDRLQRWFDGSAQFQRFVPRSLTRQAFLLICAIRIWNWWNVLILSTPRCHVKNQHLSHPHPSTIEKGPSTRSPKSQVVPT